MLGTSCGVFCPWMLLKVVTACPPYLSPTRFVTQYACFICLVCSMALVDDNNCAGRVRVNRLQMLEEVHMPGSPGGNRTGLSTNHLWIPPPGAGPPCGSYVSHNRGGSRVGHWGRRGGGSGQNPPTYKNNEFRNTIFGQIS